MFYYDCNILNAWELSVVTKNKNQDININIYTEQKITANPDIFGKYWSLILINSYKSFQNYYSLTRPPTEPPVVIILYIKPAGQRMILSWGKEMRKHTVIT